ncbi:serine O-acetyltransferase [Microlunatus soli]|uniref:Serine O-acetyltransferase n=1 Tax=Microlunatus soli TaxID=630515 RepID=A0A1H1WCM6_9ACTN|nr:DapH/DapD/GlmU-related protein [Microlunatus soli]SDS94853.1 serine O-acetyltransferase [Microlunatus soli]
MPASAIPRSSRTGTWSLRRVLAADLTAMAEGETLTGRRIAARICVHARWRAVVSWRLAQRLHRSRIGKPLALWLTDRTLGFSAAELQPKSSVGPGLVIKHTGGLVVGGGVVAGARLTLHQNVTLGDRRPFGGQPELGDDVTVGAGACVLGPISIGDGVVIAANSVVLADVPAGCVVAGAPARIVRRAGPEQVSSTGRDVSAGR